MVPEVLHWSATRSRDYSIKSTDDSIDSLFQVPCQRSSTMSQYTTKSPCVPASVLTDAPVVLFGAE